MDFPTLWNDVLKPDPLVIGPPVQTVREGSGSTRFGGWYPGLFYQGRTDSGVWDATVTDADGKTLALFRCTQLVLR